MADRTCSIEGCERPHSCHGWCKMHYTRWQRHGDPLVTHLRMPPDRRHRIRGVCTIDGCDRPHVAHGWCQMHYSRWWLHGEPTYARPTVTNDPDLFWAKVDKDGPVPEYAPHLGPCWLWLGGVKKQGEYGYTYFENRQELAHRHAYRLLVEEPPVRPLCLDHLCRVRICVRPAHLEVVTLGENVLRGMSPSAVKYRERALA